MHIFGFCIYFLQYQTWFIMVRVRKGPSYAIYRICVRCACYRREYLMHFSSVYDQITVAIQYGCRRLQAGLMISFDLVNDIIKKNCSYGNKYCQSDENSMSRLLLSDNIPHKMNICTSVWISLVFPLSSGMHLTVVFSLSNIKLWIVLDVKWSVYYSRLDFKQITTTVHTPFLQWKQWYYKRGSLSWRYNLIVFYSQ
jgi:hypothetical protein